MTPYLQAQHVRVEFPKRNHSIFSNKNDVHVAVDDVSLEIARGEIFGLVGESGCGKTTLSRALMQLQKIQAGNILLDGVNFTTLSAHDVRKRRLDFQMIFQDPQASLNPRMTVYSTLAEAISQRHPSLKKQELTARVAALMKTVGLDAGMMKKYPHEFSGGQKQRIAIARALAPEPKLIIADEPVSALDVSIQSQILNLLKSLQREYTLTLIFISHDLGVIRYMADRTAIMQHGKIVELNETEKLFAHPQHDYTKKLLSSIPKLVI